RKPHTCELGLEYTNILVDDYGFIRTNEFLQTHEPNIYAIGDVRSHLMTANQAISDATIAVENIIQNNTQQAKTHEIPHAIYSAIEMARIGLNEDQAEDLDYEPATGFAAFESSPTAIGQNDTEGFLRVIADMDSGKFLGGEIVGRDAGELIHLMALQQNNANSLQQFAELIVNHPSRGEEIVNATETLASKWNMQDFVFK
ncbi:MAG: FAD-dependent oxidoreductase, partial [Gammaproteobacteria bacterium]|nr:FAD-dependent oxidoreductase [Gammaproteobacteria bacterium]